MDVSLWECLKRSKTDHHTINPTKATRRRPSSQSLIIKASLAAHFLIIHHYLNMNTVTAVLLILALMVQVTITKAAQNYPFTLGIRDSIMIAHSFHNHPSFGPAGGMHGATYTCDVEFLTEKLAPTVNWVMDIGFASEMLSSVLAKYNYKNLDEVFPDGEFTTTEFMARQIYQDIVEKMRECAKDAASGDGCADENVFEGSVRVKLFEKHNAWASYEGKVEL